MCKRSYCYNLSYGNSKHVINKLCRHTLKKEIKRYKYTELFMNENCLVTSAFREVT